MHLNDYLEASRVAGDFRIVEYDIFLEDLSIYRLPAQLPIVSEIEHFLGAHGKKVDRIEPRSRPRLPEPISGQKCECRKKTRENMKNHFFSSLGSSMLGYFPMIYKLRTSI